MVLSEEVTCEYVPLKTESLSFALSGEYIGNVYVQEGQTVEAGELLAELVHDNLMQQISSQEFQLQVLQLQKKHIQENQELQMLRQDALIAEIDRQIADLDELLQQRTAWETLQAEYEEALAEWEVEMKEWEEQQTTVPPVEESQPSEDNGTTADPDDTVTGSSGTTTEPDDGDADQTTEPTTEPAEPPVPAPERPQTPDACPVEETAEELNRQKEESLRNKRDQEAERVSVSNGYEQQLKNVSDSLYVERLRLEELENELAKRQIHAGMDGIVNYIQMGRVQQIGLDGSISYYDGISPWQTSVQGVTFITIIDPDSMLFTVKGTDAELFPVGTEVTIIHEEKEMMAISIEAPACLESEEDESTVLTAYLRLNEPNPVLQSGDKGEIHLILDEREDVLYLEAKAVHSADGKEFVYVLNEEGLRVMQEVTTGLKSGIYVEITDGLAEGDSVIVE